MPKKWVRVGLTVLALPFGVVFSFFFLLYVIPPEPATRVAQDGIERIPQFVFWLSVVIGALLSLVAVWLNRRWFGAALIGVGAVSTVIRAVSLIRLSLDGAELAAPWILVVILLGTGFMLTRDQN
ncbi:MAG: hypothetical protein LC808_30245 [Actinobacteria bacterium]|nr:hypothetical protein [Actinomycetota bacterium]